MSGPASDFGHWISIQLSQVNYSEIESSTHDPHSHHLIAQVTGYHFYGYGFIVAMFIYAYFII